MKLTHTHTYTYNYLLLLHYQHNCAYVYNLADFKTFSIVASGLYYIRHMQPLSYKIIYKCNKSTWLTNRRI